MAITDWSNILKLEQNDPNVSMNSLHHYINNLLDISAPYKKLSKKEIKLKSKPWISTKIQSLMNKRGKLFTKFLKHVVNYNPVVNKVKTSVCPFDTLPNVFVILI